MSTTIPVTLTLPPELVARVDALAEAQERSRSAIVRRVLRDALADRAAQPVAGHRFDAQPRAAHSEASERP